VGSWGGLTALLHAAREGHVDAVFALIDTGADINQGSASDGTTPLLMATLNGQFDLALQLVERGADVNRAAKSGAAPLFSVVQTEWAPKSQYPQPRAQDHQKVTYLETMEALLKAGADPNARLKTHIWYMEYARNRLNVDMVGATPFFRAAFAQDVDALKLLVKYGADPSLPTSVTRVRRGGGNGPPQGADPSGLPPVQMGGPAEFPIHAATGLGYLGIGAYRHRHAPDGWLPTLQYLVGELGADVNARDAEGYTALHYAASRGDKAQVVYLLSQGADASARSRGGRSTADMARGGAVGLFEHVAYPEVVAVLEAAGSK
jgi:ankyrin repeat protein